MPTLSPAWPWSSSFLNISTPVQVVLTVGLMPTISISSPTLTMPRSTRPGHHRAAPGDGEHVFHRHQEGAVDGALGLRDVGVQRFGQLHDGSFAQLALVAFQGQLGRAVDDGGVVAGEVVLGQQLAHFHLHQLQQLGVIDHVALVQEHDDVGHAHLAGQQDVLAGLGHRAVGGGTHQDGAVHLGGAGDHVLDVVGVAGAVHVRVVAVRGLVLDVGGVDGDAARLFFRGRIDLVVRLGFAAETCASTVVIAAVSVVLPWSTWPIVPTFTCGLVRSNFPFAIFRLTKKVTSINNELWCPWRESDPRPLPYQGSALPLSHKGEISFAAPNVICGAGDGNRTRVISLEG